MNFTEREISKEELDEIYADFERIERRDGVPKHEQKRYQYIAEIDGKVVGFVSGLTYRKWFYLSDLWVDESLRRQGIGAKLLKMLEEKVVSLGIRHIYTWTSGFTNPIFYKSQGYYVFTEFENFYDIEGYNQVGLRKDFCQETDITNNCLE